MKKTLFITGMFCFLFFLTPAAYPWGWAVHTYIDEQYDTKWALRNDNQIYGGLSPDVFNFRFDALQVQNYLFTKTHNDFMKVWNAAQSVPAKALAFGFVSHNEVWGADYTAHRSGLTFGQAGTIPDHPEEGGYVIAKAYVLRGILNEIPQFAALQLPPPVALTIAHELVERGVDILMKQIDPQIGAVMAGAAIPPNPGFPRILEKVYAGELAQYGMNNGEAIQFFAASERQFRQMMVLYGQALMEDDATAIYLNAEQLENAAKQFLAAYGLPPLPEGVDIKPLLQYGIYQAMLICSNDFAPEVFATINMVDQQLAAHGIAY